jgi:hypothetical protein
MDTDQQDQNTSLFQQQAAPITILRLLITGVADPVLRAA